MNDTFPTPAANMHPQIITLSPPCLTVFYTFLVFKASLHFLHTFLFLSLPKRLILISLLKITVFENSGDFNTYSLANSSLLRRFSFCYQWFSSSNTSMITSFSEYISYCFGININRKLSVNLRTIKFWIFTDF